MSTLRIFSSPRTAVVAVLLCAASLVYGQDPTPEVSVAVHHDVSPALRNIPATLSSGPKHEIPLHRFRITGPQVTTGDPVIQSSVSTLAATTPGLNFDGVGVGFTGPAGSFTPNAPPDTNGAVGANQYVQWVNESFAVFDKSTGSAVYGPTLGNTLWSGFGGGCQTNNDGDPLVVYDKAANRWVMSQFSVSTTPYLLCVAVSTTSDATGTWYRYAFQQPDFPDYPKMGVWPDGYYESFNMFQGNSFVGGRACAMNRQAMLNGALATQVCFQLSTAYGGLLPSDLDGVTAPPAGSPDYFLAFGSNVLQLWKFHVDFANTANSTFTGPTNIGVAPFSEACNGGTCIPQGNTRQTLDSLGDRLMHRLAYRNFGDREVLVANHSVTAGSSVGIRWYEVHSPNGTPTIYQQGTYAPDANYRWMGSIAMDQAGNIALGYSVSSSTMYPSIAVTGRYPTDTLGQLQAENSIWSGSGSQLPHLSRWGDYSAMTLDPSDDCTFWFTTEYLKSSGTFNWSTRIASFKFASCGSTGTSPDYSVSASPSSQSVQPGNGTSYTTTVTPSGGFTGNVSLSVSGLPTGATASFSPNPVSVTSTASVSSTLSVSTATTTPTGNYTLTITASSGAVTHTTTVALAVSTAGTPWQIGFDMRATQAFISDVAPNTYVLGTATLYPTTRNGATFGWASTAPVQTRDRSTAPGPQLAGINFIPNNVPPGVFQVDLPAPGTYNISLALGDYAWSQCPAGCRVEFRDGSTTLFVVTPTSLPAANYADANGLIWSAAAWPANNTARQVSMSGTTLTVLVGANNGSGNTTVAYLGISQ